MNTEKFVTEGILTPDQAKLLSAIVGGDGPTSPPRRYRPDQPPTTTDPRDPAEPKEVQPIVKKRQGAGVLPLLGGGLGGAILVGTILLFARSIQPDFTRLHADMATRDSGAKRISSASGTKVDTGTKQDLGTTPAPPAPNPKVIASGGQRRITPSPVPPAPTPKPKVKPTPDDPKPSVKPASLEAVDTEHLGGEVISL